MRKRVLAFIAVLLLAATGNPATRPFMRGVVVSCPRWGPVWGSEAMVDALAELRSLGVEWAALHPYGWVRETGHIQFTPAAELGFLATAVELAERAGISLFWKPHLGYWGSFPHRGAIDFGNDPAAWARFFRDYRAFIVDQAAFAESAGIDLLAVGVELDATTRYEEMWRLIITDVREVYSGRLVYAANWDRLDAVPFWDALELIGVHAYFPLSDRHMPDRAELERGWESHLETLRGLAQRFDKPVLFAEIGYNISLDAARTPWAYATEESSDARSLRRLLIDVAISKVEGSTPVAGMFWWKWMPGPATASENFSMREPEARAALLERWGRDPGQPSTAR